MKKIGIHKKGVSKMKVYTTTEVAELLQISSATVRNEVKRGKLGCFYVGIEARFSEWHLSEYMKVRNMGKTSGELELEKQVRGLEKQLEDYKDVLNKVAVIALGSIREELSKR